jgi:lysophospholipase L1-like esterase
MAWNVSRSNSKTLNMRPENRRRFLNSLLVILSLAACGLVGEAGLRVYAELLFPKMMVFDDTLGWRHATNVKRLFQNELGQEFDVTLDEFGHRGAGHPKQPASGKYRILVVGDSFTEGVQVGETDVFTGQIERANPRLEVINAGVGGYGTVQEYLYLRAEGIQFRPDLVLLVFFENDLSDNVFTYYAGFGPRPYANLTADGIRLVESLDSSVYTQYILPAPFQMALNNHSYLYYFLNSRIYQPMFATRIRQMQQAELQKLEPETLYKVAFGMLDKFNSFLKEQQIPLLVVLVPSREDVAQGRSDVSNTMYDYCRTHDLNCLPLIDKFRQTFSPAPLLYFREDMHWAPDGHKLAAEEIARYLQTGPISVTKN